MHFSRVFLLISAASLASLVFGAPVALSSDDESSLVARDDSDLFNDLALRALTGAQKGQRAAATIQKQQARKATKAQRAPANKAAAARQKQNADNRKAAAKAAGKKPAKLNKAQVKTQKLARNPAKAQRQQRHSAAAANAKNPAVKAAKAARRQANRAARPPGQKGPAGVQGARKARVAARTANNNQRKAAAAAERKRIISAQPGAKPHQKPKMSKTDRKAVKAAKNSVPLLRQRPQNQDKIDVSNHLKGAAQKMQTMRNVPGRNDRFSHARIPETRTGKDVRKAIMNSHLHNGAPVGAATGPQGQQIKPQPKHFGNYPPRGQPVGRPLPGSPQGNSNGLKEYPVKQGGAGWHGEPQKGAVRVITDNRRNEFHGVVTHPGRNSRNPGDLLKMTQTT